MTTGKPRGRPAHPDILTPGEWRVAEGVRHGLTNEQIARRQAISRDAVKYHVSNILSKLGLQSRQELRFWPGIDATSALHGRATMDEGTAFGTIGQIARSVGNIDEARKWYRDVLGLEPLFDAGTLAFFACNGVRLMLAEGEATAESVLYFRVDDLHREFARLEERGAKVMSAPHRIHTHEDGSEEWMGFVEDNDGRPLALMSVVQAQN